MESLTKFELWKPGTKTVVDHEEIRTALMIVPRTIIAILIKELIPMLVEQSVEFSLDVGNNVKIKATKHERDVYSGTVEEDNKVLVDFKNRSVPGLGLVIMSAFELYNINDLPRSQKDSESVNHENVQKLIDDRLALHSIVERVVEHKIAQRDAIKNMMLMKLTSEIHNAPVHIEHIRKGSPLKDFLELRKNKQKSKEFSVQLAKGEHVDCPDCGKQIFAAGAFSGCVCLGDDMDRKIFIKKSEEGVKIRFGRGWDEENIELLLELLRRKHE